MDNMQLKSFGIDLKSADDAGIIEAIVSVFSNVDSVGDRIEQGFFNESLTRIKPKGLYMHNWQMPVAKTLEARELAPFDPLLPDKLKSLGGLYIKAQFNLDTQVGRETYSNVKQGILDEFSIGFTVEQDAVLDDGTRSLKKGTLYEWSVVLFGANPLTALISAKSGLDSHIENTGDSVAMLVNRLKERTEIRRKEGRKLSGNTVNRIKSTIDVLRNGVSDLEALLAEAEPDTGKAAAEAKAKLDMLRIQLHMQGILNDEN